MKKSEIRKDYITNRYVIIAPARKKRPRQFVESVSESGVNSPFTPERLKGVKVLDSIGAAKRRIVSIANIFPAVTPGNPKAFGRQEVIIETPSPSKSLADLPVADIENLIAMYQRRTRALLKQPKLNYVLCFKNEGLDAGASISHAHSQVFATEIIPPRVAETRERLEQYRIEHGVSLYADVIEKEMKSSRRVFGDKHIAIFCPYASAYENEVWIVTKRALKDISGLKPLERKAIARALKNILQPLKEMNAPYNYFFHALKGAAPEHLCLRLQPRAHVWAGVELDSSMTVNWVPPEEAAKMYRKAFKKS